MIKVLSENIYLTYNKTDGKLQLWSDYILMTFVPQGKQLNVLMWCGQKQKEIMWICKHNQQVLAGPERCKFKSVVLNMT